MGSCVFSTCLHRFWTLSFWNCKVSQMQLPFLALESAIPLKSPGSFYWRAGIRNQDTGAKCVHRYRGIAASSSSQWTWLRNTYMYTNPHSHICISIYIWLPVCDWVLPDPPSSNTVPQNWFHPSHFPHMYPFSLTARNPALIIHNLFTFCSFVT